MAPAPAVLSHPGSSSTLPHLDRIEAEAYDDYDEQRESCEGRDGEHTRPVDDGTASEDQHLFLPYGDGCGVEFDAVVFPAAARFDRLRVKPTTDEDLCREIHVFVDGRQVASSQFCGRSGSDGWARITFDDSSLVTRGRHDVRVEHEILPGRAEWANLRLDWLSLEYLLLP